MNLSHRDKTEPVLLIGILTGFIGCIYSFSTDNTIYTIISGIVTVTSCVAEWRIRKLAVAKKISDSVIALTKKNILLEKNITTLEKDISIFEKDISILKTEISKFEAICLLLDDNIVDVSKAKDELFYLYDKYKVENYKYESNNLFHLFTIVDKNGDSKLSLDEVLKIRDFVKVVYKRDLNIAILNKDENGEISLTEFFKLFNENL